MKLKHGKHAKDKKLTTTYNKIIHVYRRQEITIDDVFQFIINNRVKRQCKLTKNSLSLSRLVEFFRDNETTSNLNGT